MNILCPAPRPGANLAPSGLLHAADCDGQPEILLILTPPGGAR